MLSAYPTATYPPSDVWITLLNESSSSPPKVFTQTTFPSVSYAIISPSLFPSDVLSTTPSLSTSIPSVAPATTSAEYLENEPTAITPPFFSGATEFI